MPEDHQEAQKAQSAKVLSPLDIMLQCYWTLALIASYVIVFLVTSHAGHQIDRKQFIDDHFALSVKGLAHGYAWQFITYQFMHASWLHLILNCWCILVFGFELEYVLGSKRYLYLLFASGVVGGLFQISTALLWPHLFGSSVVGASACAFGLVAAFATLLPKHKLTVLLLLVVPVRIQAKTLLIGLVVIALVGIAFPFGNISLNSRNPGFFQHLLMTIALPFSNVANAAHLGGLAMGWFYIKHMLDRSEIPELLELPPNGEAVAKPAH